MSYDVDILLGFFSSSFSPSLEVQMPTTPGSKDQTFFSEEVYCRKIYKGVCACVCVCVGNSQVFLYLTLLTNPTASGTSIIPHATFADVMCLTRLLSLHPRSSVFASTVYQKLLMTHT